MLNAPEIPFCIMKSSQYSWYDETNVPVGIPEPGQVFNRRQSCRIVVARWKKYDTQEEMLAHIGEFGEARPIDAY